MLVLTSLFFYFCSDGIKLNASIRDITLQEFKTSTMSFFVRAPEKAALNGSRDSDAAKDDDL